MGSLSIAVIIALILTVLVLLAGIISMARGGEFDRQHSAHLMFTRISIQTVAIILVIAAALYAANAL